MGNHFYWKSNYGDKRVEEMLRSTPNERQPIWGVDCEPTGCAFSSMGRMLVSSYDRIHASLLDGMVARVWRFDKFYGRFDAEEFTFPTLVIRQWMKDLAVSERYSAIEEAVLEFALGGDEFDQWRLINGLDGAFLQRLVGSRPTFEEEVCFDYHRYTVFKDLINTEQRAKIFVVEDHLGLGFWNEILKRAKAAKKCKPLKLNADEFSIAGSTGSNYRVNISAMVCDCADFIFRGRATGLHCKHLISALQASGGWDRWENSFSKRGQLHVSC
jgi:hypothetical protein